ncbi:hypothetical protein L6472_12210 [Prevotella sp. E13-17]|uniref:hypothetical protein n=1 Tax=Prevotella sp. E13-17 TaxID=2913616 RepID=UPI001EDA7232|nr:hypothetical protein [Prevotella sp. E13-17]UKK50759.1 hypothetical protein L6472_12210 [Prevotella sp. E13-17]
MNKLLLFCMSLFAYLGVYGNDSILVDRVWTERRTVFYNKEEMDSIGEGPIIENSGIACGYAGCTKIEFLRNHRFRKIYPYGKVCPGRWMIKGDVLTIIYDKKERRGKKRYRFKIKYREKEECPTLYLFEIKHIACYIFCDYHNVIRRGAVLPERVDEDENKE